MKVNETLDRLGGEVGLDVTFTIEDMKPKAGPRGKVIIPSFKITGTTTIMGKFYSESFSGIPPSRIPNVKEEIKDLFKWFVEELYKSKSIKREATTEHLKVDLRQ